MNSEIKALHLKISLLSIKIYRDGTRSIKDKTRLNSEINWRHKHLTNEKK